MVEFSPNVSLWKGRNFFSLYLLTNFLFFFFYKYKCEQSAHRYLSVCWFVSSGLCLNKAPVLLSLLLTIPFLEWIVSYRILKRIHFSSLPPPPPRTYRLDPFLDMPFTSYFFVLLLENDKTTITRCLFSWREGFRDEVTNPSWVSSPFSSGALWVVNHHGGHSWSRAGRLTLLWSRIRWSGG